jgi:L-ascorbate metabolism protein UlaG (beta-lactamase superfamily)
VKITWWGHATATVEFDGARVLTDPLLVDRLGPLRRQVAPVPRAAATAELAVVSHLHADHLHLPSLQQLPAGTRIVMPRGSCDFVRAHDPALAARVVELAPGERRTIDGIEIVATRAHHDGRRRPGSRHRGPALGSVLRGAGESIWFAGDTGLFGGLDEIGPVDAALVPVGGWGPTLGPQHLDPDQAAQAVRRVGARAAVPVHYGTYWPIGLRRAAPRLFQVNCREPGERFAAAAKGFAAHVVAPGGSVQL